MVDVLRALLWVFGGTISIGFAAVAFKIWRGDRVEYARNRMRTPSALAALKGDIPTSFDGKRDFRVAAGVVIDNTTNEWRESGRLSEEAISSIFGRSARHR